MSQWPAYSEYSHTDLPWLGEIPNHWDLVCIKYTAKINMGQSPPSDDYTLSETDMAFLQGNAEFGGKHPTPVHYCPTAQKHCKQGDLLLSVRAPVGEINVADRPYGIGRGLCSITPSSRLSAHFAWYALRLTQWELQIGATGSTYDAVSMDDVRGMTVPIPPLPEQRAIADFLDRETARIDALVTRFERLIVLLEERRAALISHAVTKGLDPDVPMKDSGIPWLGEIPTDWEVAFLWTVAYLQRGHDLPSTERIDGQIPIVSSSGISGYHSEAKATAPGVVTGRYGTIGEVYYIVQDYWPLNTALYVRDFHGNHPRYIYYLLQILPFGAFSGKSAVPGIDRKDLHALRVVAPPLTEQRAIATHLDHETSKLDVLVTNVSLTIGRLHEYRTALISAAVTGKIDVREATR